MRLSKVYHGLRNLSLGVILMGTLIEEVMDMRRFTKVSATGTETVEGCLFLTLRLHMIYQLLILISQKKKEYFVNFKTGNTRAHLDFFFMMAINRREYIDTKVIPSECLMMQHRLLVMDVEIKSLTKKRRSVGDCKLK